MVIIGHGREGGSAARYLTRLGAQVTVVDRAISAVQKESCEAGTITLAPENLLLLTDADAVVASPGVPESNHLLTAAIRSGIPVTNATQIFFSRCRGAVVGITGSSGKSTTTALIGSMLVEDGGDVRVGGNIGNPMLDFVDDLTERSIAVLELSSFQLQLLASSPHVAVVTNITPNHLDRHGDLAHYVAAKRNIVSHQSAQDVAILNVADEIVRSLADYTEAECHWFGWQRSTGSGSHVENDEIFARSQHGEVAILAVEDVPLPGRHNVENVLAAVAAASALGVDARSMAPAIRGFKGLPHRLQLIGVIDGVRYVDDSIATSPERVAVALAATQTPVVLVAGGRSKHLPWMPMLRAMEDKVHTVVLLGEAATEIGAAIEEQSWRHPISTIRAQSLQEAISHAGARANPGDTVLLSPGGTSYDMFTDFEERGRAFQSFVEEQNGRNG